MASVVVGFFIIVFCLMILRILAEIVFNIGNFGFLDAVILLFMTVAIFSAVGSGFILFFMTLIYVLSGITQTSKPLPFSGESFFIVSVVFFGSIGIIWLGDKLRFGK
jgi:hypothetical protein